MSALSGFGIVGESAGGSMRDPTRRGAHAAAIRIKPSMERSEVAVVTDFEATLKADERGAADQVPSTELVP